ncbi:MAG: hypothetical protein ACK5PR_03220, partial [bacterium]
MQQHISSQENAPYDEVKLINSLTCIQKMVPTWSDERIWSYLRYSKNINVSKKVVTHLLEKIDQWESTPVPAHVFVNKTIQKQPQSPLWQMD